MRYEVALRSSFRIPRRLPGRVSRFSGFSLLLGACSLMRPKASGEDEADKEYRRKLDLYGVGGPCPKNQVKLWGRATASDYGVVGLVESTRSGQFEQTVWVGRSGEHAAALTCSGGTVVSKALCGSQACVKAGPAH